MIALALGVVWVIAVIVQLVMAPQNVMTGPLSILMTLLVVFLPLALLWGIIATARTIRALRVGVDRSGQVAFEV